LEIKNSFKTVVVLKDSSLAIARLLFFRAKDRVRTGDIQLGRLTLYQLSYFRKFETSKMIFLLDTSLLSDLWGEQDSNLRRRSQQIYSLPSLAA
jgi:hypothetical protein